jgi:hypothetical protein
MQRRLDGAVNTKTDHHPVERNWDNNGLEHERDCCRHIEVRRLLNVRLPCDGRRQHHSVR